MTRRLLLGRAGTGKTRSCLDLLAQTMRDGGTGMLLVPTYSQAEHLRLELLGRVDGLDPGCVQTFTSLAERVTGIRVRDLATPAVRDRIAGDALAPDFARGAAQPGFRAEFLAAVKEIKEQGQRDALEQARTQFAAGTRERGLFESYARYVAALGRPDHEDHQLAARSRLRERTEPLGRLLVDGFHDFTPVQRDIVELLSAAAVETVVTLPLDPDRLEDPIFSTAARTLERFDGYARVPLRKNRRASGALALLEAQLFRDPDTDAPADGIEAIACSSEEDEADRLARFVRNAARPFSDFLVVRRSFDGLQHVYRAAFRRHGVPLRFFMPEPLAQTPAARAVALWLRASSDRAEPLDLLYLLRSPYFLTRPEAAQVDAWAHALRRNESSEDFWTPDDDDDEAPLGRQLARRFGLRDALIETPDGDEDLARAARLFAQLQAEAAALDGLPLADAKERLARRLPALRGAWPDRRHDCVYAVEALHARQWEKPVVLVAGLTADSFPRAVREDVFVRDEQRRALGEDSGLFLPLRGRREDEERYLFYVAMTRAKERIVATWAAYDEE
ncbi:MAG: hypothetical protein OER88_00540, partial [Planctomycetota bacterium]|nr:hypothetical protein [Planctomycetota bacterium]